MDKLKKVLMALLFPHVAVIWLLVPVAAALLIYAFMFEDNSSVVSIVSYCISAYALTVICMRSPVLFQKLKYIKDSNKYVTLYTSDARLRVKLSLFASVGINTLYALMQLFSGFYFHSVWFYALAGYYTLLAIMRYFLLKETVKSKAGGDIWKELLIYRFCGVLLLLMNLTLAVIVSYIVWQNRGFEHHYIQTIAMAAYTFTAMTMAIINIVKYRKYGSPVMSASKAISLAAALVSMLSLETAMLTSFGEENSAQFRRIMTGATGTAVCTIVLAMAIYMIVNSTKKINKIKSEKANV